MKQWKVSFDQQERYLLSEEYAESEFQLPFFVLALHEYVGRFNVHHNAPAWAGRTVLSCIMNRTSTLGSSLMPLFIPAVAAICFMTFPLMAQPVQHLTITQ